MKNYLFDEFYPVGTILTNEKNKKKYIIINTRYNGDDNYYSYVDILELDVYNTLEDKFTKSEIEDKLIRVDYGDSNMYSAEFTTLLKSEIIYTKGGIIMSLIKFTRPLTIYLPNNSEFIFRDGYSYMYDKVDDGIIVWNVDKSVSVRLSFGDVGKWCGEE